MAAKKSPTNSNTKKKTPGSTIPVTDQQLDRAEALIPALSKDPAITIYGIPKKTTVLRLAVNLGLQALEAQHLVEMPVEATPSE